MCLPDCPDLVTWEISWIVDDQCVLVQFLKKADTFYVEQQSSEACTFLLKRFQLKDHLGELQVNDFVQLVLNEDHLYPDIRFTNCDGSILEVYTTRSDSEKAIGYLCSDKTHVGDVESHAKDREKIVHCLFDLLHAKSQEEKEFDTLQTLITKAQNAYKEWKDFPCSLIPVFEGADAYYTVVVSPDTFAQVVDRFILLACPVGVQLHLLWDTEEVLTDIFFIKKRKSFIVNAKYTKMSEYFHFFDNLDATVKEEMFKDRFKTREMRKLILNTEYGYPVIEVFVGGSVKFRMSVERAPSETCGENTLQSTLRGYMTFNPCGTNGNQLDQVVKIDNLYKFLSSTRRKKRKSCGK